KTILLFYEQLIISLSRNLHRTKITKINYLFIYYITTGFARDTNEIFVQFGSTTTSIFCGGDILPNYLTRTKYFSNMITASTSTTHTTSHFYVSIQQKSKSLLDRV
ncbi:hypothetical protein ACJX0J_018451, partial [Zea mays]